MIYFLALSLIYGMKCCSPCMVLDSYAIEITADWLHTCFHTPYSHKFQSHLHGW